jgi:hypothetical protein
MYMLVMVFQSLSRRLQAPAMAALVAGGVLEITSGHMAEEGVDIAHHGLEVLMLFASVPCARERMRTQKVLHQLIEGLAKGLLKVRSPLVS